MSTPFLVAASIAAMHLSPSFAGESDVISRARAAFHEQLGLACPSANERHWIASDAIYKYRLTETSVLLLEGRAAAAAHLCALRKVAPEAAATNIHVFPTLEKEKVFVQYNLVPTEEMAQSVTMLAMVEMKGNQIAQFTLFNRSPESLAALRLSDSAGN